MADKYTKNSAKVLNSEGKALVPGAYELLNVSLIRNSNSLNKSVNLNITELITDIMFTEELFSPVMVAKLTVSDTTNSTKIFKDNPQAFEGYEVLEIEIKFIDNDNTYVPESEKNKIIKFRLGVREYTDFELDNEGVYSGVFSIVAVDNFAILSRLQQISFSVGQPHDASKRNKTTIDHIALIFKKYLNIADNEIDYSTKDQKTSCSSIIRGIIPFCTPLQAIEWLRTKSYDFDKSPFFVYGVFNKNSPHRRIVARSWNWLIDEKKNKTYPRVFQKTYNENDNINISDEERYLYETRRILEFTTSTTKNELKKFLQGEYNTIVKTIDYKNNLFDDKTSFNNSDVDSYVTPLNTTLKDTPNESNYITQFNKNQLLRKEYIETLGLQSNDISLSSPAVLSHRPNPIYDNTIKEQSDSVEIKAWNTRAIRFFTSKISNEHSEIVVYGDLNLNPGTVIKLDVDKDSNSSIRNARYIIIASVHSFVDGRYVNRLKLVQLPQIRNI